MKLHFEPNLDYQLQAIEAVCDLFRGQEVCRTEFTVTMKAPPPAADDMFPGTKPEQLTLGVAESDLGVGNRLTLLDDELHQNLADIQLRGGLPPSGALVSGDFTVEMETGTGKTYVYLRSIFELNKRYGFSKFVIVVPSVAIKEGVYKTLQITEEHFKGLYAGVPFDYFLYDSNKLGQVRNFATSSNIQVMVVTVGAINKKDVNNLYKDSEKTGGEKPIDLIKATRPVVIVDEPQSVDGGLTGAGKTALDAMNPLCTLRYSATHVDKHHMVFRLDAVDAYERKLVKQIEVASATVEDAHNKPFVRLVSVANRRGTISARVELDVATANGVRRQEVTVSDGDDLEQAAERAIYADFRVGEINTAKGEEFLELRYPGGETFLRVGQAHGDVDALAVQREMIRRTIKEHLDKEKRLRPLGIKVLSLFFIDAVDKYRQYDADGNPVKGDYARIFEEEYRRAAKLPAYQSLFGEIDLASAAEEVHNGYFSIDKKGGWTDTSENTAGNRENAERAYNLIMKEKEKLLSFDTPLKFIFSHSALKEGWDNPNVFHLHAARHTDRARAPPDHRPGVTPRREPERRARARIRGQYPHRDCHRELRAIRREPAEGNRGRHRHPLWHRRAAPVRRHHRYRGRRPNRASGRRSIESAVGAPESCRPHRCQGQGPGFVEDGVKGWNPGATCGVRRAAQSNRRGAAQGVGPSGNQERRRAQAGCRAQGRLSQPRVQGAVGSHQVQDDLSGAVR